MVGCARAGPEADGEVLSKFLSTKYDFVGWGSLGHHQTPTPSPEIKCKKTWAELCSVLGKHVVLRLGPLCTETLHTEGTSAQGANQPFFWGGAGEQVWVRVHAVFGSTLKNNVSKRKKKWGFSPWTPHKDWI